MDGSRNFRPVLTPVMFVGSEWGLEAGTLTLTPDGNGFAAWVTKDEGRIWRPVLNGGFIGDLECQDPYRGDNPVRPNGGSPFRISADGKRALFPAKIKGLWHAVFCIEGKEPIVSPPYRSVDFGHMKLLPLLPQGAGFIFSGSFLEPGEKGDRFVNIDGNTIPCAVVLETTTCISSGRHGAALDRDSGGKRSSTVIVDFHEFNGLPSLICSRNGWIVWSEYGRYAAFCLNNGQICVVGPDGALQQYEHGLKTVLSFRVQQGEKTGTNGLLTVHGFREESKQLMASVIRI